MKNVTVRSRAVITVDAPAALALLEVPAGLTLDEYREQEETRLKLLFPSVKVAVQEVAPELREMLRIADQEAQYWETKRQLVRLKLREAMEFAKKATVDGDPFVDRRIFEVRPHEVRLHEVDALYRV